MTRGVFLDRDGTLIEEVGYLDRLDRVQLFPYSIDAVRLLNRAGFAVIVTTNQAGIARGFFDEAFVDSTHRQLSATLAAGRRRSMRSISARIIRRASSSPTVVRATAASRNPACCAALRQSLRSTCSIPSSLVIARTTLRPALPSAPLACSFAPVTANAWRRQTTAPPPLRTI